MSGSAVGKMKWPLRVQTHLFAHDLVRKPVPTLGSSPRACFSGSCAIPLGKAASCITMRRKTWSRLSIRTSLERNAPESLTQGLYAFVHGDIWRPLRSSLQDRVVEVDSSGCSPPLNVNARAIRLGSKSQDPIRHPEVRAKRASKDERPVIQCPSSFEGRCAATSG